MSVLNIFTAPNFAVESITVRFFDNYPDPRAEAREGFNDYENVVVKPSDVVGYVEEMQKRMKTHNYRTFSFQEVSSSNRKATADKEGRMVFRNTLVMRFPEPVKGKPNRVKHIGINVAYETLVHESN